MRTLSAWAVLVGLLLGVGCYDTNPIETIVVSPDGRYLAVMTGEGELGVKRTDQEGPLTIYSNYTEGNVAWSPDSTRLAFIEHFPQRPPALWVIAPDRGREAQPLLDDPAWKGDPVWLSERELAFRSDREAEDIDVWVLDLETKGLKRLIDRPADVSRLWGSPLGRNLIFQSAETGSTELWWWWPDAEEAIQLTHDRSESASFEQAVTFSADGRHLAYVSQRPGLREVVWFDLRQQLVIDRTPLEEHADGLAVLDDGRVVISQDDYLLLWRPDAPWFRRSMRRVEWEGVPLRKPGAIKGGRLALSANHNLLLLTDRPGRPGSGELQARSKEDLLKFSWSQMQRGKTAHAYRLLNDLLAASEEGSEARVLALAGLAMFERTQGNWRKAEVRLAEVTQSPASDMMTRDAAWCERLALALCESGETESLRAVMEMLPEDLAEEPLPALVRGLLASEDEGLLRHWGRTGKALRVMDYETAGRLAHEAMLRDEWTTGSLEAMTLMLTGELDPFRVVDGRAEERQKMLMNVTKFQLAMLEGSRLQVRLIGEGGEDWLWAVNYRQQLLIQWAQQGDLNSARMLVGEDLADLDDSMIDYAGLVEHYLMMEEIDRWLERALSDVILTEKNDERLAALFSATPNRRMMYCLAHTKAELIAGEVDEAWRWLEQCRAIEEEASAQRLGGEDEVDREGEEDLSRDYLVVLASIFRAKVYERRRNFPLALETYREVLGLMDNVQANWDIAASDVTWMIGLLERGRIDEDLLGSYLIPLRGLGDPLVNPAHERASVASVLSSMETLRKVLGPDDGWLIPYLTYTEGLCFSKLNRPDRALHYLTSVRRMQPDVRLLQRILFEEAAIRSTLGQHALAARLYAQLTALPTAMPVRAGALMGQVRGEWDSGLIASPGRRVVELLEGLDLNVPWRMWLYDQLGVEIIED